MGMGYVDHQLMTNVGNVHILTTPVSGFVFPGTHR